MHYRLRSRTAVERDSQQRHSVRATFTRDRYDNQLRNAFERGVPPLKPPRTDRPPTDGERLGQPACEPVNRPSKSCHRRGAARSGNGESGGTSRQTGRRGVAVPRSVYRSFVTGPASRRAGGL